VSDELGVLLADAVDERDGQSVRDAVDAETARCRSAPPHRRAKIATVAMKVTACPTIAGFADDVTPTLRRLGQRSRSWRSSSAAVWFVPPVVDGRDRVRADAERRDVHRRLARAVHVDRAQRGRPSMNVIVPPCPVVCPVSVMDWPKTDDASDVVSDVLDDAFVMLSAVALDVLPVKPALRRTQR
jgi:hypothetical protein